MPPEPQAQAAQPKFICPWCGAEIDGIEFRAYGPGGIVTMFGCRICLKPLPGHITPLPPQEGKPKTPIIKP